MTNLADCALMSERRKSHNKKSMSSREARGKIISYLERNRGKSQYRHAPSAGWSANKVLRPLSKKFGPGTNTLRAHWPQIVGKKWAALSNPVTIRGEKDGKTLLIEARGPAAALIAANSGQLLAKINQFLGTDTITKLKVKQSPIKAKPAPTVPNANQLRPKLETGSKNSLQQALDEWGHKVRTRNNQ